jgi:hypothetical protein
MSGKTNWKLLFKYSIRSKWESCMWTDNLWRLKEDMDFLVSRTDIKNGLWIKVEEKVVIA